VPPVVEQGVGHVLVGLVVVLAVGVVAPPPVVAWVFEFLGRREERAEGGERASE